MATRRAHARPIGTTQPPDCDSAALERVALTMLDARFAFEDLHVDGASLGRADAGSGCFKRAHLTDVDLAGSKLRAIELLDVLGERMDAANGDWGGAQLRRALLSDARLTGLDLAEARIEDVSFKRCRLDYANFRHSKIEHASFEDCVLTGADFQGARIDATRFSECQMGEADFSKAELSRVDLRGSELALAGSLLGLRGAIIDSLQLMELARALAQELGISVEDM